MMNKQKLSKNETAKFFFELANQMENFQFDLFYDITKITNDVENIELIRNEHGQIETEKPVVKTYWLGLRTTGSYLFDTERDQAKSDIEHTSKIFPHIAQYDIKICLNANYIYGRSFAEVTELQIQETN